MCYSSVKALTYISISTAVDIIQNERIFGLAYGCEFFRVISEPLQGGSTPGRLLTFWSTGRHFPNDDAIAILVAAQGSEVRIVGAEGQIYNSHAVHPQRVNLSSCTSFTVGPIIIASKCDFQVPDNYLSLLRG